MFKKRVVVVSAGLLAFIALSFVATACIPLRGVRVGELQTETQVVELDGAETVDVEIQAGAVDLDVSGGANELLEATFTYNVEELDPQATYDGNRLELKERDIDEGLSSLLDLDEYRNEWDLKLNGEVPMEMDINLGAGPSHLDLGSLAVTRLDIDGGAGEVDLDLSGSQSLRQLVFNLGAGETTIDLTGDWAQDLDASINGGFGGITVRLPAGVGVIANVETGIGAVEAAGLTRDGDTYTNAAYGTSGVTMHIQVSGGVGPVRLEVGG